MGQLSPCQLAHGRAEPGREVEPVVRQHDAEIGDQLWATNFPGVPGHRLASL